MHVHLFMNSSGRREKSSLYTTSLIVSSLASFALERSLLSHRIWHMRRWRACFPSFQQVKCCQHISSELSQASICRIVYFIIILMTQLSLLEQQSPGSTTILVNRTLLQVAPYEDPSNIFNSGVIPYTSFFQHTFDQAGTFDYYCTIHPWRTGTVTVSDAVERGHNFDLRIRYRSDTRFDTT